MEPEPEDHEQTYELLARYRTGDAAALQVLAERYYPRVEAIVRARLGAALLSRETVADVVQDVFVRIVESAHRFEQRGNARWIDYVARMAQNEIANHARRESAQKRGGALARLLRSQGDSISLLDVADDATSVGSKVARAEQHAILLLCLGELAEPYREVILLRDYAGGDWRTVAEQMGRPSAEACQELYRRARRELGVRMQARSRS
ncbi:MAG: sigma-70 family RNA polymerase sigma factor [Planctomycetota bacterium]